MPLFYSLGGAIGTFLYDNALAGSFLSSVAWILLPLSVESITSSQMNSLDLEKRAFVNYVIGALCQFVVMFACFSNFNIYILGFATGVSLSVTSALNIFAISKKVGREINVLPVTALAFLGAIPTSFVCGCVFDMLSPCPIVLALAIASVVSTLFYLGICFVFILPLRHKTLALRKKKVL